MRSLTVVFLIFVFTISFICSSDCPNDLLEVIDDYTVEDSCINQLKKNNQFKLKNTKEFSDIKICDDIKYTGDVGGLFSATGIIFKYSIRNGLKYQYAHFDTVHGRGKKLKFSKAAQRFSAKAVYANMASYSRYDLKYPKIYFNAVREFKPLSYSTIACYTASLFGFGWWLKSKYSSY